MTNISILVKGEFTRLNRYNLFTANFVILLFWVLLAFFLEGDVLLRFIPFIFLMDSVMMTILLVGATLFYEKKEHTMNSIMVSPVSENEYLLSKIIASVLNSLITVAFISIAVYVVKGVTFNYFLVIPAVLTVTVFHSIIGIRLSYSAKDFTSMLINYMIYVFVFAMPPIFAMFGLIDESISRFFLLLPPEASGIIINAAFMETELWRILAGYVYLIVLSVILYFYVVKPKFNEYLMKETGV